VASWVSITTSAANICIAKENNGDSRPEARQVKTDGQLERPHEEIPIQEETSERLAEVEKLVELLLNQRNMRREFCTLSTG
jgi:hypothetical protein